MEENKDEGLSCCGERSGSSEPRVLDALISASKTSRKDSESTMSPTVPKVTHKSDGDEEAKLSTDGSRNGDTEDVALSFPQRLMEVLDDESNSDIASWLSHGKAFFIFDKARFENEIMPKFFNKHSKYSSFTRKLNRWGFNRVTRGSEMGSYSHPLFQKGNHRMVAQMSCHVSNKSTTTVNKQPSSSFLTSQFSPSGGTLDAATLSMRIAATEEAQRQQQLFIERNLQEALLQESLQRNNLVESMLRSQNNLLGLSSLNVPNLSVNPGSGLGTNNLLGLGASWNPQNSPLLEQFIQLRQRNPSLNISDILRGYQASGNGNSNDMNNPYLYRP